MLTYWDLIEELKKSALEEPNINFVGNKDIFNLNSIPDIDPSMESYNVERNLLAGELKRVNNFALLSENSADTLKVLDPILEYYNLSLF